MARIPRLKPPNTALERLPDEWSEVLALRGEPRYRGRQVFEWIHRHGILDPRAWSSLPSALRDWLVDEIAIPSRIAETHRAADGTSKLLVRLGDEAAVETVLIPRLRGRVESSFERFEADGDGADDPTRVLKEGRHVGDRVTQCISSQVGCAMGCVFCASGKLGLSRHMTAAEIVAQVLLARGTLGQDEQLSGVVFMGMGEPLHNYDAVARAIALLVHEDGMGLSPKRITVSTSGLVPQIDRLGEDFGGEVQLAISLHAISDDRRTAIMPVNRKYPIATVVDALRRYPVPGRRRITVEYTLIRDLNDDPADADRMAQLLSGIPVKVNLIPLNPIVDTTLSGPAWPRVDAFQRRLKARGMPVFVRKQRGDDIAAACGQLALDAAKRKPTRA